MSGVSLAGVQRPELIVDELADVETLLEPWLPDGRDQPKATLWRPFSPKARSEFLLYKKRMYALWIRLESSRNVKRLNLCVPKLPIVIENRPHLRSPPAVVVTIDGTVEVHDFVAGRSVDVQVDAKFRRESPWLGWCKRRGFHHVSWSSKALYEPSVELSNLRRLLSFTAIQAEVVDPKISELVQNILAHHRKTTIARLHRDLTSIDEAEVTAAVAQLIIDGKLYSDIDKFPLSLATQISVFCNGLID